MSDFGIKRELDISYEEAIVKIKANLKEEGFGVLTEIDVKETLKKKIDVDFKKYIILGACSPKFAFKALTAEPEIGLLLPCNVIVYENDNGKTVVSAFDPITGMNIINKPEIKEVAEAVSEKLTRAVNSL